MSGNTARLFRRISMRRNLPLALGTAGLLLLILLALFGPYLAPKDPLAFTFMTKVAGKWSNPPHIPSPEFPLGSDRMGRDILSGLLAGARYTLLFSGLSVTLALLLALPLGLYAGLRNGLVGAFVQTLAVGTSAIPQLLGAGLMLIQVHRRSEGWPLMLQVLLSAFILAIFVAPRLADLIRTLTRQIRREPYVEAATASGATTWRILFRHLLPNMAQPVTTAVLIEYATVLRMMALLGLFSIWISPTKLYEVTAGIPPDIGFYPAFPEWASYTGFAYTSATLSYWVLVYPGLAITGAILVFHLLSEGLRRHWQLPEGS